MSIHTLSHLITYIVCTYKISVHRGGFTRETCIIGRYIYIYIVAMYICIYIREQGSKVCSVSKPRTKLFTLIHRVVGIHITIPRGAMNYYNWSAESWIDTRWTGGDLWGLRSSPRWGDKEAVARVDDRTLVLVYHPRWNVRSSLNLKFNEFKNNRSKTLRCAS